MNPFKKRLRQLREIMKEQGIDAFIIPNADPHLGENIPDHWKSVQWLSGFTGSAATIVVSRTNAGLLTDSRYFLQAERELEGSGFELMKSGGLDGWTINKWLLLNIRKGGIIAFDGRLISAGSFRKMRDMLKIRQPVFATDSDLISGLWEGRPSMPDSIAFEHSIEFSGIRRDIKIESVRKEMAGRNIDYHLLNAPDDIMWLLNIRGADISYSPILLCRAIIGKDQVLLFADEKKLHPKLSHEFDSLGVVILPYDELNPVLASLAPGSSILLSVEDTPVSIFDSIPDTIEIKNDISIPSRMKAVKNVTERENIRNVMIKDGVALTRFFIWLEKNTGSGSITEGSAAKKLGELRLQQTNCTGESFMPIVAYNEHAALPHYSFAGSPETVILNSGSLLVDSGGQYLDGTTDTTRCIALSRPSVEMKRDFTLALKGMIKLAAVKFPYGTRGSQLDILSRKTLWDNGINFGHGTGHGVGFFLNVHESPPVISSATSSRFDLPLEPGMIVSDEPGIYREGKYGFRTENLIMVVEDESTEFGLFLKFETLTLCYIDRALVEKSLLDSDDITWLNSYHTTVYRRLSNFLSDEEREWLNEKTGEI
ncbi:MAG: aminopeptidase P family protein [Bacteroidales bacterium]|jgi:Xaa-Pro aminopeptidase